MNDLVQLAGVIGVIMSVLVFILNLFMAAATYHSASNMLKSGRRLYMMSPEWWALIVFAFSLAGFACFWAMNHSTLRQSDGR